MLKRRVVITGLGAVTPIGLDVEEYWQGLVAGKNGIAPITSFDTSPYPVKVAGEVKGFNPEKYMALKRCDRNSRVTHMAIAASKMAIQSANLDISKENPSDIGVIVATSGMMCMLAEYADTIKNKPLRIDPLFINKVAQNMMPAQVGLELGIKGLNTSINSACCSGSDALGTALSHIQLGHVEMMIAGGSEAGSQSGSPGRHSAGWSASQRGRPG